MKAVILSDKDYETELCLELKQRIIDFLTKNKYAVIAIDIGQKDLTFCMGCFGCWVKKPGECVIQDKMAKINASYVESDVFIYLSPVIFGQVSANIKNAMDRFIPNILPFFITRSDGSTIHPSRYEKMPQTVYIGYGTEISEEDESLFIDIVKKHRYEKDVFVLREATGAEDIFSGLLNGEAVAK